MIVALGFLTRLPVGRTTGLSAAQLTRAAVWFPAVGLVVGAVAGGVHAAAGVALEPGPATVLALLAAVLVTGAFHEDGLADAADAIGAHTTRERRMAILHDSRVGTYGALAVAFALLFAFAVLSGLDDAEFARAVVVGHVLGRWSTLPLSLLAPVAPGARSGTLMRAGPAATLAATAFAGAVAVGLGGWGPGGAALAMGVLAGAAGAAVALRALGGVSGDVYGAVNKLVELAAYAALAAAWG